MSDTCPTRHEIMTRLSVLHRSRNQLCNRANFPFSIKLCLLLNIYIYIREKWVLDGIMEISSDGNPKKPTARSSFVRLAQFKDDVHVLNHRYISIPKIFCFACSTYYAQDFFSTFLRLLSKLTLMHSHLLKISSNKIISNNDHSREAPFFIESTCSKNKMHELYTRSNFE